MLAATFLPWVLLRPNRLAAGEFLRLPLPEMLLGVAAALLPALAGRFFPRAAPLLASFSLALGAWWLGSRTGAALSGQAEFARASASSGVWLWLLGAAITVYGAGLAGQRWGGAQRWLAWLWLPMVLAAALTGHFASWSVVAEYRVQHDRFLQELWQHLRLILSALGLATLIGAPLSVWASRSARVSGTVLGLAGGIQTVPSLALLGLLIAPLSALANAVPGLRSLGVSGIGVAPALTAMTLYALLPVLRNGVVALRGVLPGVLDAARGMGMTDNQRFWRVQLPLALPVWLSGIRQAAVMLVGVASVAQLIGAGGLGYFIFSGLQSGAADLILLGALPAALLAILLDIVLRGVEALLGRQLGRA
ncbi:ABC transporter permease [Deinococcus irradiatisoli]|uniref:ABC transporter permease n=2 Tax=Deinococcus irradiatisoli TaxID=2202254 RepID=A0A2Z3JMP5_9DEIO|nr:ABC transporter permease [Deinococcus irradiatisoli]AWN24390.1 ABC transporter permease [Deinococcus irradiatisoli]